MSNSDNTSEVVAKAGGIYKSQKISKYFLESCRRKFFCFFCLTGSLSSSMQGKNVTACDAKAAVDVVFNKITKIRADSECHRKSEKLATV